MSNALNHGTILKGAKNVYLIDRELGQGAFGITYLAKFKQKLCGEMGSGNAWVQVCIKEFFMRDFNSRSEDGDSVRDASGATLVQKYRKAFFREANNLARMHHPGIVNVFEVVEANNTIYIVMEYVDGYSLDEYIQRRGKLTEQEALAFFYQLCDAMQYLHRQKMLHLDLKPKNMMLDEEGHLYLIDFGLSKQYGVDGSAESSTIGLGTPGYAPSEQADFQGGDKSFRATIDIYAMGATLYKMLTGQTPPNASEIANAIISHNNLIMQNLLQAGVSENLADNVARTMWPASAQRPQTVQELQDLICEEGIIVDTFVDHDDDTVVESGPTGSDLDETVTDGRKAPGKPNKSIPAKPEKKSVFRDVLGNIFGLIVAVACIYGGCQLYEAYKEYKQNRSKLQKLAPSPICKTCGKSRLACPWRGCHPNSVRTDNLPINNLR